GDENIGAGRERSVSEADVVSLEIARGLRSDARFCFEREPVYGSLATDPMSAVVNDAGRAERGEQGLIDVFRVADETKLTTRDGARRKVTGCLAVGAFERFMCNIGAAQDQCGFGFGSREPEGVETRIGLH